MRLRILVILVSLSIQNIAAQTATPTPGPAAPRPQGPPRDAQPQAQTGTAIIKGRITAADTGRPLRRARVTASAPELGRARDVSTDVDGRYEIKDLPAGRYSLSVNRSGYLRLRYGQRRPLEQGKQLDVANGQTVDSIDFAMPKMSVIAGRVTDELGDPIEGANVFAMRMDYFQGRRRVVPGSQVTRTDDVGQYRITGLMPGTYWVMATIRETWTITEGGKSEVLGYAPTYLPGTTNLAQAMRVAVGLGQEAAATDFPLVPGRAAKVSGIASDARGMPLAGGNIGISQETVGTEGGMFTSAGGGSIAADGTFSVSNVPPGEYKIRATAAGNRPAGAPAEIVTQVLIVDGQDIEGLRLTTTAGWSMSGRIRTDSGEPLSIARNRVSLLANLVSPDLEPRTSGMFTNSQLRDDWTFAITNIFGPSRLHVTVPNGWAVKSVLQGDRDVTDEAIDMGSGEQFSDVEVVLTNVVTRVNGRVTDADEKASADATVLFFAAQREKWFDRSRWIRAARPDHNGAFQIEGLPAGDYLAVALDYVQEGVWNDPEYLASLAQSARKITLRAGESSSVPLKVVTPPAGL
jgi:hypothetical protein